MNKFLNSIQFFIYELKFVNEKLNGMMNGRMSECMQAFLHARTYASILACMQEGLDGSVY